MRSLQRFAAALGLSLVAVTVAVSVAEAQSRRGPLRVTIQKRSYFDAGNVVPVGSLNRYATQHGLIAADEGRSLYREFGSSTDIVD